MRKNRKALKILICIIIIVIIFIFIRYIYGMINTFVENSRMNKKIYNIKKEIKKENKKRKLLKESIKKDKEIKNKKDKIIIN